MDYAGMNQTAGEQNVFILWKIITRKCRVCLNNNNNYN